MDSSQEDPEAIDAFIRVKLNDIMVTMTHPLQQMNRVYQPPNPNAATSFPLGTLPAKVPVIRIFGITPKHQSVCLNVHGIWPYFFVEYPQGRSLDPDSVYRYTHRFANALNSALCQSLRQDPYGAPNKPGQGTFNTSTLHVASIVLCKGVPFYGYHVGYSYFLKIALVTPSHKYRAVNLLEGGSIMQKKFAVYESHLDTKLQFMVDFDLYGCGWVEVQEALFRRPLPEGDVYTEAEDREAGIHNDLTVTEHMLHPPSLGKDTWSDLEIDVFPWQILNRRRLKPRYLHDALKELLYPHMFDPNEKFVRSVRELWKEESRRRVELNLPPEEGMVPPTDDRMRTVPSQGDHGFKGGIWDSSEAWEAKLDERIRMEEKNKKRSWNLEDLGRPPPVQLDPSGAAMWDKWIPTTFEIVEAGWPRLMTSSRRTQHLPGVSQSSPVKMRDPTQQPTLFQDSEDLDQENPFTQIATSQVYQSQKDSEVEAEEDLDVETVERIGTQSANVWHESEVKLTAEMEGFRDMVNITPSKPGARPVGSDPDLAEEEMLDPDFVGQLTQMRSQRKLGKTIDSPATASRRARGEIMTPEPESPTKKGNNPYYAESLPSTPSTSRSPTPRKNLFARSRQMSPSPPPPYGMAARQAPSVPLSMASPFNSPSKVKTPSKLRYVHTGHPLSLLDDEDVFLESTARAKLIAATHPKVDHVAQNPLKRRRDSSESTPAPKDAPYSEASSYGRKSLVNSTNKSENSSVFMDTQGDDLEPTLVSQSLETPARTTKRQRFADDLPQSRSLTRKTGQRARFASSEEATSSSTVLPKSSSLDIQGEQGSLPRPLPPNLGVWQGDGSTWVYDTPPPSTSYVQNTLMSFDKPEVVYQKPYFSKESDLPSVKTSFGTRAFQLYTNAVSNLLDFSFERDSNIRNLCREDPGQSNFNHIRTWTYNVCPPSRKDTDEWLQQEQQAVQRGPIDTRNRLASQLGQPTQAKFRYSDTKKGSNAQRESQNMACLTLEVFAPSRGRLLPDPKQDPIVAVFYCLQDSNIQLEQPVSENGYYSGIWLVESEKNKSLRLGNQHSLFVEYFDSELDLFNEVINRVRIWNPDVLAGWEVHGASWGYLAGRAMEEFSLSLSDELSRVRSSTSSGGHSSWNQTTNSAFKVIGRHVFNIWRIMRGDLNLLGYAFENVAYHLLKQRFPHYSPAALTSWYNSRYPVHTVKVLQYYIDKVTMYMEMMDAAEICTKNAEFAQVFGVDFNYAMTRGSQIKVESFMFRIAKPESFVLVSPSKEAVGKQNAAECQALVQEPASAFYEDPVLVLDFQSLYPSIMIGYNYCYSTCLGRIDPFRGTFKMGWTAQDIPEGLIGQLRKHVTISPNGRIYAKQSLRKSLLAKMLKEILDTRIMVKQGMKTSKGNKSLLQVLNARQLGIKLMANVTYGYTGASFSGRMPCVEIADDIVQTGRETLEKAIQFIDTQPQWGAKVIYGDTDSLFVLLEGRTIPAAFRIGNEIADQITARNPRPIKLKFEKVYTKCVLEAKKRYVGFKMESIDEEPSFDAKGIETVRRDGCPAAQKMLETVLKLLFRKADLSEIKQYCVDEWTKILEGKISIQDLIIAKEVKLGSYSENGLPPPGAVIAGRRLAEDPMDEAEYGERVPFIITKHGASDRLVHKARAPEDLLNDRNILPDAEYYITRQLIPPLNRVLKLVGVDAAVWYQQMPKRHLVYSQFRMKTSKSGKKQMGRTLDATWKTAHCLACGAKCGRDQEICGECKSEQNLASTMHVLSSRYHLTTNRLLTAQRICASCSSTPLTEHVKCDSIECPVLYARVKASNEVDDTRGTEVLITRLDREARQKWPGEEIPPEVITLIDSDDD